MHFLTNESPDAVFLMASGAVMSLALLFTVTAADSTLASMETAFAPAAQVTASIQEVPDAVAEAVYATAVYVGIIPESQSVYAAVDFPPQVYWTTLPGQVAYSTEFMATLSGAERVAGAIITAPGAPILGDIDILKILNPASVFEFLMGE